MKNNRTILKDRAEYRTLTAVLALYAVFSTFFFHYERLTGDSTLYLSIAEKYLRGDFSNAINGYWGPLLSWLLIPFLSAGASHVFAVNALHLIFGLLTIIGVWRLSQSFEMEGGIRRIMLPPLVPILLLISLIEPMDFLLLCVLVYYLAVVFRKGYPDTPWNAVLCGALGALAYFSKPYGFPFFLSHFFLMTVCHYLGAESPLVRKRVLRNFLIGLALFSVLSGGWISLISMKYDRLTFSTMGKGVFSVYRPGTPHGTLEKGDPIFFEGFFTPPNDTAFVIYEDPTDARGRTWSPLDSKASFRHFLKNLMTNITKAIGIYESFSRLSFAILILHIIFMSAQSWRGLFTGRVLLYPLLTLILYTGGYVMFHFEARYLWIVNILLLLMGGNMLNELLKHDFFRNRTRRTLLLLFFTVSFIITPLKSTLEITEGNINREMYLLGTELRERYDIGGNIASNREGLKLSTHDSWHKTFRLSYWLNSRYFGQAKEDITDEELENELRKHDIDYYFLWGEREPVPEFLVPSRDVTGGEIRGLKIFSLKNGWSGLSDEGGSAPRPSSSSARTEGPPD